MRIDELLNTGKENATSGRELAQLTGLSIREVTQHIEAARRDGAPICATSGSNPGYYLAADGQELTDYCNRLKGRAIELFKTRQALIRVLKKINKE